VKVPLIRLRVVVWQCSFSVSQLLFDAVAMRVYSLVRV
jgi:hypothetical protein